MPTYLWPSIWVFRHVACKLVNCVAENVSRAQVLLDLDDGQARLYVDTSAASDRRLQADVLPR